MVNKFMSIPNDNTQNNPFCKLQLVVETFVHLTLETNQSKLKVPKVVEPMNKKTLLENFGDKYNKQPNKLPEFYYNKDDNIHYSETLKWEGKTNEIKLSYKVRE